MKFGNSLQYQLKPEWKENYICYNKIKLFIKNNSTCFNDNKEEEFKIEINNEIKKIVDFFDIKYEEINSRINNCEMSLNQLNEINDYTEINESLSFVTNEILELDKYINLNSIGIIKILKKHDKKTTYKIKPEYQSQLEKYPFNIDFNDLIIKLSRLFAITNVDPYKNIKSDEHTGTEHFIRSTTKYWIHKNNITEVKCKILKHLPVLIYNTKTGKSDPAITSIYFDNENFDFYEGRLKLLKGAEAFRIRWYGGVNDSDTVYMERKINQGANISESSHKERFPLKEKYVNDFLSGKYNLNEKIKYYRENHLKTEAELEELKNFSSEYQSIVLKRGLKPVLRTFYNRIAFQFPEHARIRISLDTDLCMIREDNLGRPRCKDNWRREDVKTDFPFEYLPEEDITRFPYGILEIKLQTQYGVEAPKWITELINSHLVEQIPKFSKFVHGVSVLNKDRVPLLPYWLSHLDQMDEKKKKFMMDAKGVLKANGINHSIINGNVNSDINSNQEKSKDTDINIIHINKNERDSSNDETETIEKIKKKKSSINYITEESVMNNINNNNNNNNNENNENNTNNINTTNNTIISKNNDDNEKTLNDKVFFREDEEKKDYMKEEIFHKRNLLSEKNIEKSTQMNIY